MALYQPSPRLVYITLKLGKKMKKSTVILTVLVVAAFLVATVLGLQNPKLSENQNESPESSEYAKDIAVSDNPSENNQLAVTFTGSSLKT